jgi:glycerol-3-phosphate acyltransferase PlsY
VSAALWITAVYLLGCVNGGYYAARLARGIDLREHGSGNAGATNAGRTLGKWAFLPVFAFDAAKMVLALRLAQALFPGSEALAGVTMLAVIVGHIYPAQLGFRGGKGVSCLVGAGLFLFSALALLICACIFALLYLATRRYTLSGLTALAAVVPAYPVAGLVWGRGFSWPLLAATTLSTGLVLASFRKPGD